MIIFYSFNDLVKILGNSLGVLDLLDYIYSVFGFKYQLELSTRPEKYLGDIEDWNLA
jgi:threonyl-tRNA synthetase